MSMTVIYDQNYPGGAGQDESLEGFNDAPDKTPVTHSEDWPGNGRGSAEMNADKTIVVPSDAASTNWDAKVSNNSTVQAKTVATYKGDA